MVKVSRDIYGHSKVQLSTILECDCGEITTEEDEWIDIEYIPEEHTYTITCPKCGKTYEFKERFQVVQEVVSVKEASFQEER